VKRCFRLTRSDDFKRVRNTGKSYAQPIAVLYALKSDHECVRVGVSAGRAIGNAIKRNRAKRLLRAAISGLIPHLRKGFDLLIVARSPLPKSNFQQTQFALQKMLERADLIDHDTDNGTFNG